MEYLPLVLAYVVIVVCATGIYKADNTTVYKLLAVYDVFICSGLLLFICGNYLQIIASYL